MAVVGEHPCLWDLSASFFQHFGVGKVFCSSGSAFVGN
jgi:hypothetical protein